MPGLVKIGKTTSAAKVRMDSLYRTGVPVPFDCILAVEVKDIDSVEGMLHTAFGPHRINPRREFYKIDEIQARVVLELIGTKNVTPIVRKDNEKIDEQSRQSGDHLRSRRPNLNFDEMEIPQGSKLDAVNSKDTAKVVSYNAVVLNGKGEPMSLTAATKKILGNDYNVAPTPHWRFKGELLRDVYERTYGQDY